MTAFALRRTNQVLRLALAAILVSLSMGSLESSSAQAASNGSWSVYPTAALGGTARIVYSLQLKPGKTLSDAVTITNTSASPINFHLYAADAFNTPGGGLSLSRRIDPVQGIGAWIHLAHSGVVVMAHASVTVPFTVAVPTQATPGDHVGGIVAEDTSGTPASSGSVPITVLQAVGVRVYARVEGPLVPKISVSSPVLRVEQSGSFLLGGSGHGTVAIAVTNGGNTVLTPVAHLIVSNSFGTTERRTLSVGPLLPGDTVRREITFQVRALGPLQAQVHVSATGAQATASSSQWYLPWVLFSVVLLAAMILGFLLLLVIRLWRRRKEEALRQQKRSTKAAPSTEDSADLMQSEVD